MLSSMKPCQNGPQVFDIPRHIIFLLFIHVTFEHFNKDVIAFEKMK